ncbi:MAG TPA: hypothetical protein VHJ76_06865, partial [Actinomycetota bacterium]|nr:hypothetical protein [Actinomycetota bacterium]
MEVPGLSPVRAFFLVGVLAAIPVALLTTRDAEPSTSPGPAPTVARSPSYELTEAEAIAEFERLNAQLMAAYRERNIALAEDVFTSDSPMLPRVRKEIAALIDSSVVSVTKFQEVTTETTSVGSDEIVLERVQIVRPRFKTETGEDVTGDA